MTSEVSNRYKDATVGINMVALNEDNIIDLSLDSIRDIADEVIFVDNGSTDQTVDIVKNKLESFDVNYDIYKRPNLDLEDARHFATEQTNSDWILIVDADHVINTDRIRNCIAESGDEAVAYRFRYLSLFGDFEHVGLHFSHSLPDAVYGRHPALIKNSAKIINAKRATRFPTPYLHEPARALLDLLPTDRFQTPGPIKSLLNHIPGRPSSTLLHLPYHKRINMGIIGVNMDGCKPAPRLLCRQDYSDFYKAKQNGRNIQNLKKFSMEKRGYETEQEYDRYAKRRLLTALKNKAVPAEEYINRELDIPIKDVIPQTVSDEIINGPRYKILYKDDKIAGREPDIPIGTKALNEPIDTDRYD